ncbi:PREDICTED: uncharacterized protein LOC108766265 [Trachymyrmex cornetzi]|uniref:uncharacterized protein LOC108766265 n=1 Tax=Trachymyrmex cornetzi TaxID=471704 RepID=UPI00084EF844|nr:PREDICTED: uncharacterized protein LOC108766265 [Trachymyrmex cornetzi]
MTKITIINCIIAAVCIFQTAEAGLLGTPLVFLDTMKNQVSNTIENVKERIQNGKETYDRLTDGLVAPQTGLSTITPSNNMQEATKQVMKIVDTCIMKNNLTEIEELINATKNVQNVLKNFQDASLNCIHDSDAPQCFLNVIKKIFESIKKVIDAAYKSTETFPTVAECMNTEIKQLTDQVMSQFVQYVEQYTQTFKLPF